MEKIVVFDFETYMNTKDKYTLRKLSDIAYICDPRFQVISIAILVDGKVTVYPGNSPLWLPLLKAYDRDGYRIVAHNARFDLRVLALRFGFIPASIGDTMLMARYLGFPSCDLRTLSEKLLADRKLELETDGLRLEALSPAAWDELCVYNSRDVELTQQLYTLFLPLISADEFALINQTLQLCLKSHSLDWNRWADFGNDARAAIARMGFGDWPTVAAELPASVQALPPLADDLLQRLALIVRSPKQMGELLTELTGQTLATTDKKKLVYDSLPDVAKTVLSIAWRRKELEKDAKSLETIKERIVIPGSNRAMMDINYSKAITHRWSSGGEEGQQSFNMQNMKKSAGVRELWVPDPGHVYVIADLAQIEARVVAWYGQEVSLLEGFAKGTDIYCDFGQHIFGHVLNKKTEGSERQICKTAILGLGFGMGAEKFLMRLDVDCPEAWAAAVAKLGLTDPLEAAKTVVGAYRGAYRGIASLARKAKDAFVKTVLDGTTRVIAGRVTVGYNSDEKTLVVRLPTGGVLRYRDIEIEAAENRFSACSMDYDLSYATKMGRRGIQYSSPIENIVQSTARDILGHQLIALEIAGCDIRFHAHDEVIIQCKREVAREILRLVKEVFASPDNSCPGLPLACSGFLSDKYMKSEDHMAAFTSNFKE